MRVRPGQKWRDVTGPAGAQIIDVESVDGNTVQGFYSPEDSPEIKGTSAWTVDEVESHALIHDLEWPRHRVVVPNGYGVPNVQRALARVGTVEGMQSQTMGGGGSRVWVDMVAPTEAEAVALVKSALAGYAQIDLAAIHVNNNVPHRA